MIETNQMFELEITNKNVEEMVLIVEPQTTLYRLSSKQSVRIQGEYFGTETAFPRMPFTLELVKRKVLIYPERFTHINIIRDGFLVEPDADVFTESDKELLG
jgi:hypothetical protein